MSIKDPACIERRRKPDAVRNAALEVARRLLIAGGPGAITLKAIGAELGMSHANLIHHFGSAETFQARLKDRMVLDITRKATALLADGGANADTASIIGQVFDAYADDGLGMLMAWSILTGAPHDEEGITRTTRELVAALEPQIEGPDAADRAREMILLVTLLAFADSLIGKSLATMVGAERDATRKLTKRLLEGLGVRR